MTKQIVLALGWCAMGSAALAQAPLPRGHVFFRTDFEDAAELAGWTSGGRLESQGPTAQALCMERREEGTGSATVHRVLPVEKMRGYLVYFSARIKAQDVSTKPQPWNGVKFMAPIVTPGGRSWPAAEIPAETFDWQVFTFAARVPEDAQSITLTLGLENVTGQAWFDEIEITVGKPPIVRKPRKMAGPVYKGHNLPRLRGAMVGPDIDEEGLRVFGQEWKANLVRWQLIRRGRVSDPLDLAAYDRWLESALARLDVVLPWCEKYGLRVVVDLHSPPGGKSTSGGYAGSDHGLFTDAACQRRFTDLWKQIAKRYRTVKTIWGYDLANEPVEGVVPEGLLDWQELAQRTARAIREIDPERTIIIEPTRWGSPEGLRELTPLDTPNIVYSVHMYLPGEFTHQGVHGGSQRYGYPGQINGKLWDKAALETALRPAIEFQETYGVHLYIGEFSAIRWAPDQSACRYLSDLIDIFEAHGWDWSYHAFREWDGWSVEHGNDRNDRQPAQSPTDRQRLLRSWYGRNAASGSSGMNGLSGWTSPATAP